MLQAYIDDSAKGDPDLFVLAGYVSTVERWAAFSDEWQRLIDYRSPHYRKLDYFKMAEMSSERDRERCAWFYKVIEDHTLAAISVAISTKEVRRQVERMFYNYAPEVRAKLLNPWHYAVSSMIWTYAENRPIELPMEPIDFIFDEALGEKGLLIDAWDVFKQKNPKQGPLMGSAPVFRDDKDYLPLQAADLFAWWIRHWQRDGLKAREIYKCEFPWPRQKKMPWTHIVISKPHVRAKLREIRTAMGPYVQVAVSPRLWLR